MEETKNLSSFKFRGIEWRVNLGVLPELVSSESIDDLRRAAANGRRKYADLRRRYLVDPHIMEDGQKSLLNKDNPLSQDPDSIWGRFFKNAELERNIDKDLTRLYPEHGSYFQIPACQTTLRRILLVWSLAHQEYSYQQGMHELLAPLLYVLHVDVVNLSRVKHLFEDLSDERFDGLLVIENNVSGNFERQSNLSPAHGRTSYASEEDRKLTDDNITDILRCHEGLATITTIDELDQNVKAILLGSDGYGMEGELGALLSGRFLEHDAYNMFDALLRGHGRRIAMADFFMNFPASGSIYGIPPIIEASGNVYGLLAVTDVSLYNYLVELQVEPQFFALRWLRVLFSREFELHDLLLVWDAIFLASSYHKSLTTKDTMAGGTVCPRSAIISAVAVSMLLELRSSLLASPNATTCLKRLLNFPRGIDITKLIETARSLQPLAMSISESSWSMSKSQGNLRNSWSGKHVRSKSASFHASAASSSQIPFANSPELLKTLVPESYWEEKWKTSVMQNVASQGNGSDDAEEDNSNLNENGKTLIDSSSIDHGPSSSVNEEDIKRKRNKMNAMLTKSKSERFTERTKIQQSNITMKGNSSEVLADDPREPDTMSRRKRALDFKIFHSSSKSGSSKKDTSKVDAHHSGRMGTGDIQNLPNQSESHNSKSSHSQKSGFPPLGRKSKLSSGSNSGKFHWIWNIGRIIPGAKSNSEGLKESSAGIVSSKEAIQSKENVDQAVTIHEATDEEIAQQDLEADGNPHNDTEHRQAKIATQESSNNESDSNSHQGGEKQCHSQASSLKTQIDSDVLASGTSVENSANGVSGTSFQPQDCNEALDVSDATHKNIPDVSGTAERSDSSRGISDMPIESNNLKDFGSIGLAILEKVQLLESTLLQEMQERDSAAFGMLSELRELSNKLLQMCQ